MIKKTTIFIAMIITITATVFSVNYINSTEQVYAQEDTQKSQISVSGKYTEKVKPDIAYIQVNVKVIDKNADTAQTASDSKMNKVLAKIKELGIEDKDLKTTSYSMYPVYEWNEIEENISGKIHRSSEKILKGYEVNNTVRVTIRDLDKTGKVLDLAINEDVTQTNMITFGLSDELKDQKYIEALKKATKNAEQKAKGVASVYDITLDKPKNIVEGSNNYDPIIYKDFSTTNVRGESAGLGVPIESGELEITASVSVTYEY